MNEPSIRTKVAIWFVVILVVALGLNFIVLFTIGENVSRETARDDLREMVEENYGNVRYVEGDAPETREQKPHGYTVEYGSGRIEADDFLDMISGVATGIYDADGSLIYGKKLIPDEMESPGFVEGKIRSFKMENKTLYVLDRSIGIKDGDRLWIRGMIDRSQDRGQVYRMYRIYIFFIPLMILLVAVIGYLAARRTLSPLDMIADEIGEINRETDLTNRITVKTEEYEIKVIVESLNHMLERLEDSYNITRDFTAKISHDLRTPVSIISAQSELALEEEMQDEQREAFESIRKQVIRISEILDALLTYTRINNVEATYEMSDIDLSEAVRNTCESFRFIQDENLTIEEDIQKGIRIKGNDALIHGMVENLLSNARKYSNDHVWIGVSLRVAGDKAVMKVCDKGVGIAKEEQERIFEWMYQTDEGIVRGGSGIGLYIVKSITRFHDADIFLESAPGEGSTFTIEFPLAANDDPL